MRALLLFVFISIQATSSEASQFKYFCKFLKDSSFANFYITIKKDKTAEITFPDDDSKFHAEIDEKNKAQPLKGMQQYVVTDYNEVSYPYLKIADSLFVGGKKLRNGKVGGLISYRHDDLVLSEGTSLCELQK